MAEITLKQLEYLLAAAEAGSVTGAATKLFLSQSAVSTALADLEQSLGAQLFVRHPRGMSLTAVGREVVADSRRIIMGIEEMHESARSSVDSLAGKLRVGCYSSLAPVLLPMVIDEFLRKNPRVELSFMEGDQKTLADSLANGALDLIIVYDYQLHELKQSGTFTLTRVYASKPYVVLPVDHPLAEHRRVSLRELAPEPMILFDLAPGGEYFLSFFQLEGLEPTVRFQTTSFEMVRALVARGLGYSILSQRTAISMSYEGLQVATRELAADIPPLGIATAHLSRVRPTARVRAFMEQVETSLALWSGMHEPR